MISVRNAPNRPARPQRQAAGRTVVRLFLLGEGLSFVAASLVHAGVLLSGHEHPQAKIAEWLIAVVLLAGLVLSWLRPAATLPAGLAAQGFALLGTLVGLLTIAGGVGPRSALDLAFHAGILLVLICGLALTWRASEADVRSR